MEKGVGRCKPNFNTIWERQAAIEGLSKRSRVDRLSTMHDKRVTQTDRQACHTRILSIAMHHQESPGISGNHFDVYPHSSYPPRSPFYFTVAGPLSQTVLYFAKTNQLNILLLTAINVLLLLIGLYHVNETFDTTQP